MATPNRKRRKTLGGSSSTSPLPTVGEGRNDAENSSYLHREPERKFAADTNATTCLDDDKKNCNNDRKVRKNVNHIAKKRNPSKNNAVVESEPALARSLRLLDPILQFLTKATGQTTVPLKTLLTTLPSPQAKSSSVQTSATVLCSRHTALLNHLTELADMQILEIVAVDGSTGTSTAALNFPVCDQTLDRVRVGFPSPPIAVSASSSSIDGDENNQKLAKNKVVAINSSGGQRGLHGSTKTAAKRRLTALKRILSQRVASKKAKSKLEQDHIYEAERPTNSCQNGTGSRLHNGTAVSPATTVVPNTMNSGVKHASENDGKDWILTSPSLMKRDSTQKIITEERSEGENDGAALVSGAMGANFTREEEQQAREALVEMFRFATDTTQSSPLSYQRLCGNCNFTGMDPNAKVNPAKTPSIPQSILPKQLSYAGSHPAQASRYGQLSDACLELIPDFLMEALQIEKASHGSIEGHSEEIECRVWAAGSASAKEKPHSERRLYAHQIEAIESAMKGNHTLVCTGTGSGKSLCFLLPVLVAAYTRGETSIILFPTKALAQDQVGKLNATLSVMNEKVKLVGNEQFHEVIAATLDGDCPHGQRAHIVKHAKIILTNPDTVHAAILPNHKNLYRPLLERVAYVVVDEAHMYEGVFGAHVAMVLSRLARVCAINHCNSACVDDEGNSKKTMSSRNLRGGPVFFACSATMPHPEHYFRLLCPISTSNTNVTIVKEDGSPRSSKHFFVWNPPLLNVDGNSTGSVTFNRRRKQQRVECQGEHTIEHRPGDQRQEKLRRRHSADETALLLARAVTSGVRCIAFCKTRCLVEWVYERAIAALQRDPKTSHLTEMIQSYRGGYTRKERRDIEEQLFQNKLLGVVGTSALELGVDIGGVDLTLHCGFPTSHASLLQQAGRAGRGTQRLGVPSLAIVVCFNSPPDQHLWRYPSSLLRIGTSLPASMPLNPGLVQEHLLCAGQEFPLTGSLRVTDLINPSSLQCINHRQDLLCDAKLFGSETMYNEAIETLMVKGSLIREDVAIASREDKSTTIVHKTHPSISKPWLRVSLRSIEPLSYNIVNAAHPGQKGRMDGTIYDEGAVMDIIPYSRVFYHAFPGAIIMHRGHRFKIVSLTKPPAFAMAGQHNGQQVYRANSTTLAAYAKPSTHRYHTRPLSTLHITVVKQIERVDFAAKGVDKEVDPKDFLAMTKAPDATAKVSRIPSPMTIPFIENTSMFDDPSIGSFAGCGIVTIRRNVHGYKKISMVTRQELSRSELSLPDMEYDSFAIWLDCDAGILKRWLGPVNFGCGVHALSHALVAVAPLFVPCVMSDIQCDHAVYQPTRVTIFDERAGGSGICAQLWKHVFMPNGLVEAAIRLLERCPSCSDDKGYEGGCPACLQFGECIKFNDYLCRTSGLAIAKRLLHRLKQTTLYQEAVADKEKDDSVTPNQDEDLSHEHHFAKEMSSPSTPRRRARARALQNAKDMSGARDRQVVVGRPSWPFDESPGAIPSKNRRFEEA